MAKRKLKGRKLTPKQETFCQKIVMEGLSLSESLRQSYDTEKMQDASIHVMASELMADPKIVRRCEALRERKERSLLVRNISDAERVKAKLREWIDTATPVDSNRIRAAELLGKASGIFVGNEVVIVDRSPEEIAEELSQRLEQALAAKLPDDEPTIDDDLNDLPDDLPDDDLNDVPDDGTVAVH